MPKKIRRRLEELARDISDLKVCSARGVKLVLFATENRFGHLVADELLPGWRLVCHCHVSDPALLAGYIFSRDVIQFIGKPHESSWSTWSEPEARWPMKADFKSREESYRYLRLEASQKNEQTSKSEQRAEEKCVLFVNFCDPEARHALGNALETIERKAEACLAECVDLLRNEEEIGSEHDTYGAITRMMAPVTRSEDPSEDLKLVLAFYLQNILAEIKRRRDDLTFKEGDLHASIHSNNLLSSKLVKAADDGAGVKHCTVMEAHCPHNLSVTETQPLPWQHAKGKKKKTGFVAFSVTFGQALLLQDLGEQSSKVAEWRDLYSQVALTGAKSVAVAPIFLEEGKLWGALNLESNVAGTFRQEDMFFLLICVRLLAVQIEQYLEHQRSKNQELLLQSLSKTSLVKHSERQTNGQPVESTAMRVAKMMSDQFRADQVIISPRCRTLWPIFEPVVWPGLNQLPFEIRKNGYTRWLSKESSRHLADGLWITREKGETLPNKVKKFKMTGSELGIQGEFRGPTVGPEPGLVDQSMIEEAGCEWPINPGDQEYNTLVGLAVGLEAAPDGDVDLNGPRTGPSREIGAVVWVKNRETIPYSAIRAAELVHMADWLRAYLTLHQDFNIDRTFSCSVFSRSALESSLERARNDKPQGGDQPHLMVLLDIDNFRWINAMCGYSEGTRIIKEVVQSMADAARRIEAAYRDLEATREDQHLPEKSIYFDIYRYGGDEFVVLIRLGRAGDGGEAQEKARQVAFDLFERWDRTTRQQLKKVEIKPQKSAAAAKKGVTYSLGVTKDLPGLIQDLDDGRNGSRNAEDCTEKLVRYLGACVRIAKKGQGAFDKTVVFEEVRNLIEESLPENRKESGQAMKVVKVLVPDQLIVIKAGESSNVRQGMSFQVLHDTSLENHGMFTDGQDLPKADLEVIEVWSDYALAKASRVAGTIQQGDRVIIRLE